MSRFHETLSPFVSVTKGSDHALGKFVDVNDQRYAATTEDLQGEGFVVEWSSFFGFTTNLLNLEVKDLEDSEAILKKADEFAAGL